MSDAAKARKGLLFVDFQRAAALQLRGRAVVHGDREREVVFDMGTLL
ncbi:MAG: hypothetical protein ACXW31_00370 [Thermoanaerobaculia bacterium]